MQGGCLHGDASEIQGGDNAPAGLLPVLWPEPLWVGRFQPFAKVLQIICRRTRRVKKPKWKRQVLCEIVAFMTQLSSRRHLPLSWRRGKKKKKVKKIYWGYAWNSYEKSKTKRCWRREFPLMSNLRCRSRPEVRGEVSDLGVSGQDFRSSPAFSFLVLK